MRVRFAGLDRSFWSRLPVRRLLKASAFTTGQVELGHQLAVLDERAQPLLRRQLASCFNERLLRISCESGFHAPTVSRGSKGINARKTRRSAKPYS